MVLLRKPRSHAGFQVPSTVSFYPSPTAPAATLGDVMSVAERHCRATNRLGERCPATVVNAARNCVAHDPERPADMRELGRASARARAERRQPSGTQSLREYLREQVDPAPVWAGLEAAVQGNNESARVAAVRVLAQELYEPERDDPRGATQRRCSDLPSLLPN